MCQFVVCAILATQAQAQSFQESILKDDFWEFGLYDAIGDKPTWWDTLQFSLEYMNDPEEGPVTLTPRVLPRATYGTSRFISSVDYRLTGTKLHFDYFSYCPTSVCFQGGYPVAVAWEPGSGTYLSVGSTPGGGADSFGYVANRPPAAPPMTMVLPTPSVFAGSARQMVTLALPDSFSTLQITDKNAGRLLRGNIPLGGVFITHNLGTISVDRTADTAFPRYRIEIPQSAGFQYANVPWALRATAEATATIQYHTAHLDWQATKAVDAVRHAEVGRLLITARDDVGRNVPIQQAARAMGYDHFNFIQRIVADTKLSACAGNPDAAGCDDLMDANGRIPGLPTFDPPDGSQPNGGALGGWKYMIYTNGLNTSVPVQKPNTDAQKIADTFPFYYDEIYESPGIDGTRAGYTHYFIDPSSLSDVTNDRLDILTRFQTVDVVERAKGFVFIDGPSQEPGGYTDFTLALVGVKEDCRFLAIQRCEADVIPGFTFAYRALHGTDGTTLVGPFRFNPETSGNGPAGEFLLQQLTTQEWLGASGLNAAELARIGISIPVAVPEPEIYLTAAMGCAPVAWRVRCVRRRRARTMPNGRRSG